jgi:hypothetical protein
MLNQNTDKSESQKQIKQNRTRRNTHSNLQDPRDDPSEVPSPDRLLREIHHRNEWMYAIEKHVRKGLKAQLVRPVSSKTRVVGCEYGDGHETVQVPVIDDVPIMKIIKILVHLVRSAKATLVPAKLPPQERLL